MDSMFPEDILEILDGVIDDNEFKRVEKSYMRQLERGEPSDIMRLDYYHALIKSSDENVKKGIEFYEEFIQTSSNFMKEDVVLNLALANARIKNFDKAIMYVEALKRLGGDKDMAKFVEKTIKRRMNQEAVYGAALVTGCAIIGAFVIAGLFKGIAALRR